MDKKKVVVYFLLIFLLALSVRTIKVCTKPIICRDSALYLSMADTWGNFGIKEAYIPHPAVPPIYVFSLVAGQKYLGLKPELLGDVLGVVLGSLLVSAVFCIALSLFCSHELALVAAFLSSVHPYLIRMSSIILRGAVYLPFLAFALAFAVSAIKNKSYAKWCVFSLLLAIASMARFEGVFCLSVFLFWCFYELIFSEFRLWHRIRYVFITFLIVIFVFWGSTYLVRLSLRDTASTWGNTDVFSLKYTGKF